MSPGGPKSRLGRTTIDLGASETCAFADINGDGRLDIVWGEYWYEGPTWTPHKFRDFPYVNQNIDDFTDLALDVDGDGQVDVVSGFWYSHKLAWWKNPGQGRGMW